MSRADNLGLAAGFVASRGCDLAQRVEAVTYPGDEVVG